MVFAAVPLAGPVKGAHSESVVLNMDIVAPIAISVARVADRLGGGAIHLLITALRRNHRQGTRQCRVVRCERLR